MIRIGIIPVAISKSLLNSRCNIGIGRLMGQVSAVPLSSAKIMKLFLSIVPAALLTGSSFFPSITQAAPVQGWLDWRGPQSLGTSLEKGLPDKIAAKDALWTAP